MKENYNEKKAYPGVILKSVAFIKSSQKEGNEKYQSNCGGTIIASQMMKATEKSQLIITAGHCVPGKNLGRVEVSKLEPGKFAIAQTKVEQNETLPYTFSNWTRDPGYNYKFSESPKAV